MDRVYFLYVKPYVSNITAVRYFLAVGVNYIVSYRITSIMPGTVVLIVNCCTPIIKRCAIRAYA